MRLKNIPEMKGCVKFRAPTIGLVGSVRFGYLRKADSQAVDSNGPYYARYFNTDFNSARVIPFTVVNSQPGRYRLQFTEPNAPRLEGGWDNPIYMVQFNRPTYIQTLYANGGPLRPGGEGMNTSYMKANGALDNHSEYNGSYLRSFPNGPFLSTIYGLHAFTYGRQYMTEIIVITST